LTNPSLTGLQLSATIWIDLQRIPRVVAARHAVAGISPDPLKHHSLWPKKF
jgi:hypothetical protein